MCRPSTTMPCIHSLRQFAASTTKTHAQIVLTSLRPPNVLDVHTPLSDFRQESVEKMERRILGVSYMCWICATGFRVVGFLCARLISVSLFRLPHLGLPRPYGCIRANRLPRLQGYHTRATTLQTNFWVQAGYHTCG